MNQDILLEAGDLDISEGDFLIGDSYLQEIDILLPLNQGELKSDPIAGPNLVTLVRSRVNESDMRALIRMQLARDGKNYDEVKNIITLRRTTS